LIQPLAAASAKSAPAVPADVFGGFTSQGEPAFFRVAAGARSLAATGVTLDMTCASGATYTTSDGLIKVPVSASGKFVGAGSTPLTTDKSGYSYASTDSMSGLERRAAGVITGTWELVQTSISPTGQRDTCDSGKVKLTLRS
jgi:hypothetical protein